MRVAFVTHQFLPDYYTGVERLTLNLATQLRRMGHDSIVITSADHSSHTGDRYAFDGTLVCGVPAGRTDLARPWTQDPNAGRASGRPASSRV